MKPRKIVIIGGGFAGARAAQLLEKEFLVTLIDEKDYFEFTPSVLRTLVEVEHGKKIEVPHRHYLKKAQCIRGTATGITPHHLLVNQRKVYFDYLVIASGSRYASPIKDKSLVIASRAKELQKYSLRLQQAGKVLIIGGGIVGVELAAEIATHFPEKKILLVHSKERLMERTPLQAQRHAERFLQKRGVKIMFNEKIITHTEQQYRTNKGRRMSCDLAFLCTGNMPNYEHLGLCNTQLNARKALCVNDFLQVQGYSHIFAAGDVTNTAEEKTAQAAERQAAAVVNNIIRLEKGEALEPYQGKEKPLVISLGKWNGIFIFKKLVVTGILPGVMKQLIEWKTMRRYR